MALIKKVNPVLYSKEDAASITCDNMYELLQENLNTRQVAVSVRGVRMGKFRYETLTEVVHIPRDPKSLYDFCPKGYDHYEVVVNYTQDSLLPDQLMTRGDFVMELLAKWQAIEDSLPERSALRSRFQVASTLLQGTYATHELTDLSYLEGAD